MSATFEAAHELAMSRFSAEEWDAMSHRGRAAAIYAALRELDLAKPPGHEASTDAAVNRRGVVLDPQRAGQPA